MVCQLVKRAAEPSRVDVVLRAILGRLGDERRGLALGADEEHAAAVGDGVRDELQGAMQHRHRLAQVENVDVVANAEDEAFHLRVPAVLLVAEMDARFEQLAHGKIGQCHEMALLYRLCLREGCWRSPATGWAPDSAQAAALRV
jgi:hypothetical protein